MADHREEPGTADKQPDATPERADATVLLRRLQRRAITWWTALNEAGHVAGSQAEHEAYSADLQALIAGLQDTGALPPARYELGESLLDDEHPFTLIDAASRLPLRRCGAIELASDLRVLEELTPRQLATVAGAVSREAARVQPDPADYDERVDIAIEAAWELEQIAIVMLRELVDVIPDMLRFRPMAVRTEQLADVVRGALGDNVVTTRDLRAQLQGLQPELTACA